MQCFKKFFWFKAIPKRLGLINWYLPKFSLCYWIYLEKIIERYAKGLILKLTQIFNFLNKNFNYCGKQKIKPS
ncbi:unnamed protein product [Blepharisma stoltei]|uniref:Uncharacterized protein n=1 Tax=Blepharisma stoltei TaxID=1481888 RepID=A0AAU9J5D9_9CILI|nr:unnamed protein product [Blepharisma stoltei]